MDGGESGIQRRNQPEQFTMSSSAASFQRMRRGTTAMIVYQRTAEALATLARAESRYAPDDGPPHRHRYPY